MRSFIFAFLCFFAISNAVAEVRCPIVPQPKEFQSDGTCWTLENAIIVLRKDASEQEHYAAERLQTLIDRRFHQAVPIYDEEFIPNIARLTFELSLDPLMTDSNGQPAFNGFTIEFPEEFRVFISGADVNGLIYGCEAFFSLLSKNADGKPQVLTASVRDWPSIPWRGRPHSVALHHLEPGQMDTYVHARLNFSDYRDAPDVQATLLMPARKASMGCPPGKKLDEELLKKTLSEFHRRGFFVFGVVACAVPQEKYPLIFQTFDELRAAGCDGVWLSMDDTGGGDKPVELARLFADYLRKNDLTGEQAMFTPPPEEYQHIDKPLNHEMAKIETFNDVQWIFTRVPCEADRKMAADMGLKRKPTWWFNYCETPYPDPKAGFIHASSIMTTQRKDGRSSYMNLLPITPGWGAPKFENLRDAPQNTDRVLLWAMCGGWPMEYALGMFGGWAWNPKDCDWETLRDSIYDYVWGPSQVQTIRRFDDLYAELKTLYWMPENWKFRAPGNSLVRLRDVKNRPRALQILDELDKLAATLAQKAPNETALSTERLTRVYLEPMQTSLRFARKQATLEFPEYEFADFEKQAEKIRKENGDAAADAFLNHVRERVKPMLETLRQELAPELKDIEPVLQLWEKWLK